MLPLAGIRVLDFTHAIAGPTATQMFQQLGAEVIKIEPPEKGDDFRHYTEHAGLPGMSVPFAAANFGKRSVTLNLKSAAGLRIARELAARADVVAENYRPGVIARLGLGRYLGCAQGHLRDPAGDENSFFQYGRTHQFLHALTWASY